MKTNIFEKIFIFCTQNNLMKKLSYYSQTKNYSIIQNHQIGKSVGLQLLCARSDFEFSKRSVHTFKKDNLLPSFWLFIHSTKNWPLNSGEFFEDHGSNFWTLFWPNH